MKLKTKEQILKKLPSRDHWYSDEVAKAFNVHINSIQKAAKKYDIGKLLRTKGRGKRIYQEKDIAELCKVIQGSGVFGNMTRQKKEQLSQRKKK